MTDEKLLPAKTGNRSLAADPHPRLVVSDCGNAAAIAHRVWHVSVATNFRKDSRAFSNGADSDGRLSLQPVPQLRED